MGPFGLPPSIQLVRVALAFVLVALCGAARAEEPLVSTENPLLQAFDDRWRENEAAQPLSARRLQQLYEAYARLTNKERAAAYPPIADRVAKFEAEIAASKHRLENFAKVNGEGLEADAEAFLAYDDLFAFDKILYRSIGSEDSFGIVCRVERYLAIEVQTELKKCRDPATPIPINGVWDQNTFRAGKSFFEEAKYWEWTASDIDLVVPSFELLQLIRKVRAEGYGGVCRSNPPFDEPRLDVEAACDRLLSARLTNEPDYELAQEPIVVACSFADQEQMILTFRGGMGASDNSLQVGQAPPVPLSVGSGLSIAEANGKEYIFSLRSPASVAIDNQTYEGTCVSTLQR